MIASNLQACLAGLLDEMQGMEQVLIRESECLRTRDTRGLSQVSSAKEQLAQRIALWTESQSDFFRNGGLSSIGSLLAGPAAQDPVLAGMCRKLSDLVESCRTWNETNGAYLGLLRNHVQKSLDILHERSPQDFTYGPDGIGKHHSSSRRLLSV
jgi:flagella synthesis protein FlgN